MTVINGQSLVRAAPIKGMHNSKMYENGVSHGLSEAGYDICIKQEITFHRDLFLRGSVESVERCLDGHILKHSRDRGNFVLASALEEFQMPWHLMGEVKDKSSWARRGLSVFNTVIEPGWKGFLTLELVYHRWQDLHIPAGSGIAQVVFYEVSDPAQYYGRYQDQPNEAVPYIAASV